MDFIASITWADLLVVLVLAVGALAGFTQGIIRYAAACLAVLICFLAASLLKAPASDALAFWTAFQAEVREVIVFVTIYLLLVAGSWLLIRTVARGTQLPVARLADEIGGALLGVLFAAMVFVFLVVALGSAYGQPREATSSDDPAGDAPALRGFYVTVDNSPLVRGLRAVILPAAGLLVRPFVPEDVRTILDQE